MPAYSFQKQFIPPIESGTKTHTIRGKRKARPRPGQTFYGFYAMRTKQCRKLFESPITKVQDIRIESVRGPIHARNVYRITIDGEILSADEMNALAVRDGFSDLKHMMEFWDGRFPFEGDIIHWRPIK